MSTGARTFINKLAAADSRKIALWTADRIRHTRNRLKWNAARLRMRAHEILAPHGRLPPGSLAASCSRDAHRDDRFYLEQYGRHGPIFKLFWASGHLKVCIVGYRLARQFLNQHHDSLRTVNADLTALVPAEYLRSMNAADHPRYRSLFVGALKNDLITGLEPEIRQIIRRELDGLTQRAREETPDGQHLHEALDRLTNRFLCLVVLGVRPDAEIFPALEAAYDRLGPEGYVALVGPEQIAVFPVIRDMVLQILESLRRHGPAAYGDSILSRLALAGESAIDDTVIGNVIYMVERGRHDFRDLLCWVIKHLSDHPSVVAELREELNSPHGNARLAEACVMETLRLEQAEQLGRKATAPLSFEGYHIPEGSWVCTMLRETHRDPQVFPEPDSYRPHRFLERTYSSNEYAPFGLDEHHCIARFLTMRTAAMFVEELVSGYAWTVTADGPRQYGQFHWRPSPSFAIELRDA